MPTATMRLESVSAQSGLCTPTSKQSSYIYQGSMNQRNHLKDEDSKKFLSEFFNREPCLYSHRLYQYAAEVFDALKPVKQAADPYMQRIHMSRNNSNTKKETNTIDFDSEQEKRLTYELVFSTLKYQEFLEDMLEDCHFFSLYPELKDDHSLVMVMLCDYKQRKFQARTPLPGEICDPSLTDIEQAFRTCKTKLNAVLARKRIKAQVLSIDDLLPQSVRQNNKSGSNMYIYCWINQLKTKVSMVLNSLQDEGFSEVYTDSNMYGQVYMLDGQCEDTLMLPSEHRTWLETHMLVEEGHLVIQDKSSCISAECVKHLLNEGDDILQVNVGSGLSTAHLTSLTNQMDTSILAFGIHSEKQHNQVLANLDRLGARGRVKVIPENFMDVDVSDERLKHIKVALLSAECSRSAVADPINFLVTEGEDMELLKDLSQANQEDVKIGELSLKHNSLLRHILRFPRMQAVIYCTRSIHEAENENVVTRSLEYINTIQQKKGTHFRVSPPVLPLGEKDIEYQGALSGKYLKYPSSATTSGCFVATITREADDPKEAAKDILARAAAKGLITGLPPEATQKVSSKTSTKKSPSRKKEKSQKAPKRSKSQPSKEFQQRTTTTSSAVSVPHHHISKSQTPQTQSVSSAKVTNFNSPSQSSPSPNTQATQMVQPQLFPSPVPYTLTREQRQPQRPPSPPPHRKVVQHPKPFSYTTD